MYFDTLYNFPRIYEVPCATLDAYLEAMTNLDANIEEMFSDRPEYRYFVTTFMTPKGHYIIEIEIDKVIEND